MIIKSPMPASMCVVLLISKCMKQFRATVKVSGLVLNTIVFADNANFAIKILQAQYGLNNVVGTPTQIGH